MGLKDSISTARISMGRAVIRSRLGQHIVDNILDPILKNVEEEFEDHAYWVGEFLVNRIKANIMESSPSGGVYEIVEVTSVDGKNSYQTIGEYQASAPGDPPASFPGDDGLPTGTLLDSISYEVDENGKIKVGILKSPGTEYTSLFFKGGKIFVSPEGDGGSSTPVTEYGPYLDFGRGGEHPMEPRPWFTDVVQEAKKEIRKRIRESLKKALRKATSDESINKAVYFRVYFRQNIPDAGFEE